MPLGEVRRRHAPTSPAADQDAEVVDGERDDPEDGLRAPVDEARGEDDDRPKGRRRDEPKHGAEQVRVALPGERVQLEVDETHDQVRDAEEDAVRVERFGDGEGDDEHCGHRREHPRAHRPFLRLERVRQPGIARPGPPERGKDEEPLAERPPLGVVRHEQGDLRDGEDEDEVEEELERGDPLLALGHRWRLVIAAREHLAEVPRQNLPDPGSEEARCS